MSKKKKGPGLKQGYGDFRLLSIRIAAVLLTAIAQPLLSAPFSWWPLHWISWIPFFWAIQAQGATGRVFLGYIGGLASNLMIFYWIAITLHQYGGLMWPFAILVTVLMCSCLTPLWIGLAGAYPWLKGRFPRGWVYLVPALLVTLEFSLPQLFPYMQGVSHYQVTHLFQIVSIFGIYGMSFLIFWANCLIYRCLEKTIQGKDWPRVQTATFCFVFALVFFYGLYRKYTYQHLLKDAKVVKVGLIQSNLTPKDHRDKGLYEIHELYMKLSQEAVKKGAQWIIWSEGEFKRALNYKHVLHFLKEESQKLKRPILLGGRAFQVTDKGFRSLNSAIHIEPSGGVGRRHDKTILVPFGEYLPLRKQLSFIYQFISWNPDMAPGKRMKTSTLDDISYAFLICYEAIYTELARKVVRKKARLLINITYDAWFGDTTAPYQHLMLAATRSAELGVPLIRLATTGVTTVVDPLGRMGKLSPPFKRKVLIYDVPIVYMPTLYTYIGNSFAWFCFFFVMAAFSHPLFAKSWEQL